MHASQGWIPPHTSEASRLSDAHLRLAHALPATILVEISSTAVLPFFITLVATDEARRR
jgi:hypothetical protein